MIMCITPAIDPQATNLNTLLGGWFTSGDDGRKSHA